MMPRLTARDDQCECGVVGVLTPNVKNSTFSTLSPMERYRVGTWRKPTAY